ncbi:MAG: hypothetical protein IPM54_28175 [Polyangiaceae bacterium]|nr:hypothetical protein [Polyangiaceae bacterium]
MRKLVLSRSLLYFLEEVEYTEAALRADSDAESLAPAFEDAIADWEALFKRERDARRNVVRTEAVVAVRNQQIDRLTMKFGTLVRAVAPAFMDRVFKVAPHAFVRANLRKQCEATKNVIVAEVAKLEAEHPLKSFGALLDTLATATITALDDRGARKGASQIVANDVLEWKEGINNLRTTTYADLLKIATAKGYPRTWVESFFRAAANDEEEAETEVAPESVPASPT